MTVQLDWPPEVVDRLTAEARERGLSLDDYVLQSVLGRDVPGTAVLSHDSKRAERQAAGRSIRELRKTNILGPELNIRDLIEEGRRL
jgi:hypothetical protein